MGSGHPGATDWECLSSEVSRALFLHGITENMLPGCSPSAGLSFPMSTSEIQEHTYRCSEFFLALASHREVGL